MRLKALPRSRAKTAWGLVQDVKRAMREEPLRVDMRTYARKKSPSKGGPACGTVGCFRGWLSILGGENPDPFVAQGFWTLLPENVDLSFGPDNKFHVFNAGSGDSCESTRPGTRAHARAVIQRINRFAKKNEAKLKAHRLPGR